jgi:hypothetical protein
VSGQRKLGWLVAAVIVVWLFGRAGSGSDHQPGAHAGSGPVSTVTPSPTPAPSHAATSRTSSPAPPAGSALGALGTLRVKGRAPMTGYTREEFGQAWLDADRNGCDTRNDILRRDLVDRVEKPGTGGCVVLQGVLHDPYLGRDVVFERGENDQVDIDHVVALGNAWATGAARFDIHERAALANDPLNLLAVDLHSNRSKGDGDAATWLPPYRPFRCAYVARQIAVKRKYGLWITAPERRAMQRVLATCSGRTLPADRTHVPTRVDQNISEPSAAPAPLGLVGGTQPYYENCDAVRAAGAAPIRAGDPGYSRKLDRDGDGVGCE